MRIEIRDLYHSVEMFAPTRIDAETIDVRSSRVEKSIFQPLLPLLQEIPLWFHAEGNTEIEIFMTFVPRAFAGDRIVDHRLDETIGLFWINRAEVKKKRIVPIIFHLCNINLPDLLSIFSGGGPQGPAAVREAVLRRFGEGALEKYQFLLDATKPERRPAPILIEQFNLVSQILGLTESGGHLDDNLPPAPLLKKKRREKDEKK